MENLNVKSSRWYEGWNLFKGESKTEAQPQEHPMLNFIYSNIFVLGCTLVSIWVIFTCVNEWPTGLKMYKSNDPRPRKGYTCACSLPEWSGPVVTASDPAFLKPCYESEKLETVTILQYDPSLDLSRTGMMDLIMNKNFRIFRNFTGGYQVDSRASEITLRKGDPKGYFDSLNTYKGIGSSQHDILINDILSSSALLDIPKYYVRWGLQFDCRDCSTCGPLHLNKRIPKYNHKKDMQWASCFAEGEVGRTCSYDNSYHGKCTIYPTSSVPALYSLKEFLNMFKGFTNITNVTGLSSRRFTPNALTLELSFMYLVETKIQEINNVTWGFLEIDEQHPWWLVLHQLYPNFSQSCGKISQVELCHLPKICTYSMRMDQDGMSHPKARCIQQTHDTPLCQDIVISTGMEIDNFKSSKHDEDNIDDQMARLCPSSITCKEVPAKYVSFTSAKNSRLLGGKSSIPEFCTRIYNKVLRYNGSNFLETRCINGLCHLTGRYNKLEDVDGEMHTLTSHEYNFKSDEHSFICYAIKKKSKMRWTIDTFGVLFGWIGTLQLVFTCIRMVLNLGKKVKEVEGGCSVDIY